MRTSNIELENELFKSVYDKTPEYIKNLDLMDFSNEGEFTFTLKKEHLKPCLLYTSNIHRSIIFSSKLDNLFTFSTIGRYYN